MFMSSSILTTYDSRKSIESSIRSTIASYNLQIDQTIKNTNQLLSELTNTYHADYNALFVEDDSLRYQLAKTTLAYDLRREGITTNLADRFFFYREDLDDFTFTPNNEQFWEKYFREHDFLTMEKLKTCSTWSILQIEESSYLFKMVIIDQCYMGTLIELDPVYADIDEYINYQLEEILFTMETPEIPDKCVISETCENADLIISLVFDKSIFISGIPQIRWFLVFGAIFYILLIPVLFRFLKKWIFTPLQTLSHAHQELAKQNGDFRIPEQQVSQEFWEVHHSFNNMADTIQHLRLENINKELARKQMLLDNLQLQIRPHFLLNIFTLLYSMIQTKQLELAGKTILYISQYFRYLFQYSSNLELFPKELTLIEQYLEVAGFQYPDSFTFTSNIDPEIAFVRVPPLLLHNFVENIISHALVHGRVTHIMFYGSYDDGLVTFQIADDGCGMSKEDVEQINSGNYEEYSRGLHVGLRNSITRLKYFYEGKSNLHVESTPNEGTIFTITFPYNLENEED
jgi:sensor histidine kinase YesM